VTGDAARLFQWIDLLWWQLWLLSLWWRDNFKWFHINNCLSFFVSQHWSFIRAGWWLRYKYTRTRFADINQGDSDQVEGHRLEHNLHNYESSQSGVQRNKHAWQTLLGKFMILIAWDNEILEGHMTENQRVNEFHILRILAHRLSSTAVLCYS
jgi:hypothetical protein